MHLHVRRAFLLLLNEMSRVGRSNVRFTETFITDYPIVRSAGENARVELTGISSSKETYKNTISFDKGAKSVTTGLKT